MRTRPVHTPAPSSVAITSPIGERARQRVPRRVEHFQGELTTLEERVLLHADGRVAFEEIARRLGISTQEVVAVALSLSGVGALVLTAVPPPIPKRPASGTRPKVVMPTAANEPTAADHEVIEVDLDLSELETLMRPPPRR